MGICKSRCYALRQDNQGILWRVVAREKGAEEQSDENQLRDLFALWVPLGELHARFSALDGRYAQLHEHLPGARVMRQDPLECLVSFICSSNNNIQRISQMVDALCEELGEPLYPEPGVPNEDLPKGTPFFRSFPTLNSLKHISEQRLRELGLGYRGAWVTQAIEKLYDISGDPHKWLFHLREVPYGEAKRELLQLPGVGPKVAACVCLFSLDKHEAIPVDTHVWRIAQAHYGHSPSVRTRELFFFFFVFCFWFLWFMAKNKKGGPLPAQGKSLTPKVMDRVEEDLQRTFGDYSGWAHNVLFAAELSSHRHSLPDDLQTPRVPPPSSAAKKEEEKQVDSATFGHEEEEDDDALATPQIPPDEEPRRNRKRLRRSSSLS